LTSKNNKIPLRVANIGVKLCKIYKDTVTATFEPVVLSETNEVSESNPEVNSKVLPEYMTDFFERSIKNLSFNQRKQIKELLIQYQHVFSKNSGDLGQTNLVQHKIDTGDSKPVK